MFIYYLFCFSEIEDDKVEDIETKTEIFEGKQNPLVVDLVERPDRVQDTIVRWFDKEEFSNDQKDEDLELDLLAEKFENSTTPSVGEFKWTISLLMIILLFK